jgi:C4-type Zn-finger protein
LNRQSETAGLSIPEIGLTLQYGTLGGRFTTVEGILNQVYDELSEKVFASGDASHPDDKQSFVQFLKNLKEVRLLRLLSSLSFDVSLCKGKKCRAPIHTDFR